MKKTKDLKISYVLPVYNAQNTIAECLRSLISQQIKPHEIILINDGSTDNTKEILKSFDDKLTINIFNTKREGAAKCRNRANSLATGDIIAVCDADFYNPERSTAINEFFKRNKDKSIFYSGLDLRSASHPSDVWYMDAVEWDFNSKCPISHPTVAYRKKVATEIKYPEESVETDLYEFFLIEAHKKGYLFGGCQNPLMVKIEGDTQRDRSEARELKIKKYEEYGIEVLM